jgi:hypothetical protein
LHSEGYTLLTRFPDDHRAVPHIVVMFSVFAHALRRSQKTPSSPIIGTNPVVAAGVETKGQRAYLRDLACDEMQGFYFSKPIAEAEFAAFLRKHLASSNK